MSLKRPIDVQIIWKSFHSGLTASEQQQLDEWLKENSSHRDYYRKAEQFYSQSSSAGSSKPDLDRAWQAYGVRERFSLRKTSLRKLAIAASVAVLVAASALLLYLQNQTTPQIATAEKQHKLMQAGIGKATLFFDDGRTFELNNSGTMTMQEGGVTISNTEDGLAFAATGEEKGELRYSILRVPRGGEYVLTLPDGTHVWMNSESSIRFPSRFEDSERKVELQGQAYFEVAHNTDKPFLVWSGNQQIQVLGTQFDLKAYQNDETMTTTLVHGRVRISLKNNPDIQQTLSPNEQCTFNKTDNSLTKRTIETMSFVSWRSGQLMFENEELGEIMKTMSRWYDVEVVFASERARHIRFTGTLMRYDDINEVVNKIAKTNEIKIDVNENRIRVE